MSKTKMMYEGKMPFVRILGYGEFYKDKVFEVDESEVEKYLRFGDFKVIKEPKNKMKKEVKNVRNSNR